MGAICGLYERNGAPARPERLAAMDDALAARAPVSIGAISHGPIGLAARRLKSASGSDFGPWHDDDGRVAIVLDGHVLNRDELAKALGRVCDGAAELIGRGFLAWGPQVFARIEGAFAIALWDTEGGALVLARDGMGLRPLLYAATAETFGFASTLAGLAADRRHTFSLDPASLRLMLAEGHSGPLATPYREVRQVAPGTVLTIKGDETSEVRFWRPEPKRAIKTLADAAAFEPLWTGIIGEHLSGGQAGLIEQDALGGTMIALALPKDQDLPVYLAAAEWRAEDMQAALALSRTLGLSHHSVAPLGGLISEDDYITLVRALDGQVPDLRLLFFQHLCRRAVADAPIALADLGAAASFAGDPSYRSARTAGRRRALLPIPPLRRALARAAHALHHATGNDTIGRFARFTDAMARPRRLAHAAWRVSASGATLDAVLGPDLKAAAAEGAAAASANDGGNAIARAMLADLGYHLPGRALRQADAVAQLNGLDLRLPFLDRRVLEFALGLAPRILTARVRRSGPFLARFLRQARAPENIWRHTPRPLPLSAARLLRAELRGLGTRLLDREAERLAPLLDPQAVRRLWRAHATRKADHSALLWNTLSLATWLEQRG